MNYTVGIVKLNWALTFRLKREKLDEQFSQQCAVPVLAAILEPAVFIVGC